MIEFVVAGLSANSVPYNEALTLQRALHQSVVTGQSPNTVLFLEHPSVYTAGRRTEVDERPVDGTPVVDVDRGGKITWHGPGQLVVYPLVRLPEPVDVVGYVRLLENAIIVALLQLDIAAHQVDGRSGVWFTPLQSTTPEKVAAIGVPVSHGVTMHGFALNCNNSLAAYDKIVACGIRDAGVTTLTRIAGREITPTEIVATVQPHLEIALDNL
ncbi:lipoyl(octanoyl) transferase LipB [Salinibacterium sp. PAMC 21357]|uniref:lipoyl(octanoyl) transferase LipB n=1 Tax=Salinibacterium sp. PAMC 21357 TaxID=1112215 RepID=UPI000287A6DB|nr:lipoyl(octanoyl) transferase LipB [Salinibacterium sp. PAMC 21357]